MAETLTEMEPPAWMIDLFKAIDSLDFDPNGGFGIFSEDVTLQFGPKTIHGIEDMKRWFAKLDEPFITEHKVSKVFRFGQAYFMQGSAVLRKKGDAPENSFEAAPLFNLMWFGADGRIIRYVVDFPPEATANTDAFD